MYIEAEITSREELFRIVQQAQDENGLVIPSLLKDNHIYRGQSGIYRDKERTASLTPSGHGLAMSVLHTGRSYADDWSDEGVFFHYPNTNRGGGANHDNNEIKALQDMKLSSLFLFAIKHKGAKRIVKKGWVKDFNDVGAWISFLGVEDDSLAEREGEPFELTHNGKPPRKVNIEKLIRQRDPQFRFLVLKHFGSRCALTGMEIPELIDAAHICDVAHGGGDHYLNGLPLAVHIHRALDRHLIGIDSTTNRVVDSANGDVIRELRIDPEALQKASLKPHPKAIEWRWDKYLKANSQEDQS